MNARLIFLGILTLFAGTSARADYAWIPGYQKLVTKAGIDVLVSESNFESSGTAQALPANGQLKDAIFWLSAEYGLVESGSLGVDLPFYFSSLVSNTSSLQGTGLGDTTLRLKWSAKLVNPFFTPELMLKVPTGDSGGTGAVGIEPPTGADQSDSEGNDPVTKDPDDGDP